MASLHRYKITIEYLGTNLAGWQRQANALSIQEILEEAIFKFSGEKVTLYAAGRTDAGVHALAQVAHFDLLKFHAPYTVMQAINHFTKHHPVGVVACEQVSEDFHARFSARARHYRYRVINRSGKVVLDLDRAWWIRPTLNVKQMQEGAKYLLGNHDFTSFRATHCQAKSPIKTLSQLDIERVGAEINFYLSAPSFLHHMVRNIVGTLTLVGLGKWQANDVKLALEAKKREAAGITAPAGGLYFTKVDY